MELFSEVYGCYYQVVEEILRAAPLNRRQVEALVGARGYGESTLQLIPKLLDQNAWPLLEEREGLFYSRLEHPPVLPVTALESSWLKALLDDPRIRLFLTDEQLTHLAKALRDVEPLYRQEDVLYFDRYLDGDDYADPDYRRRFQAILTALREGAFLRLAYAPPQSRLRLGDHRPMRLEYSAKDDKFRVYTAKAWHGAFQGYHVLNLSRIREVGPSAERYCGRLDLDGWRRRHRCAEPLLLCVTGERNGIERFMVEFSSYEKQSEYDAQTGTCTVRLWYQRDDETEVLIRLLGFGPVIRVLGPARFVELMRERVLRQACLSTGGAGWAGAGLS